MLYWLINVQKASYTNKENEVNNLLLMFYSKTCLIIPKFKTTEPRTKKLVTLFNILSHMFVCVDMEPFLVF